MTTTERRADKLAYDQVPIYWLMSIPAHLSPPLSVSAPPFPIPRSKAEEIIREQVSGEQGAVPYLSKEILRAGDLVLRHGELPEHALDVRGAWVAFIDLVPDQSFAHRCRYVLIDHDGKLKKISADWYPMRWRELFVRLG